MDFLPPELLLLILQNASSSVSLPVGPMRVRQVLDKMTAPARTALRRLIPVGDLPKDLITAKYPSALLTYFPKPNNYSCLGFLAEEMLRLPISEITLSNLCTAANRVLHDHCGYSADTSKVAKSKTTTPFLEVLVNTRKAMDAHIRGELTGESVVSGTNVIGHPDARTADQIFEMKLTGTLEKNWTYYLCQVHAYAALDSTVKDVYLVLPLQSTVLHFDVRAWAKRGAFKDKLESVAITVPKISISIAPALSSGPGRDLVSTYAIGSHMPKKPTLLETVKSLPTDKPSQIFVGAPTNSKLSTKPADVAAATAYIAEHSLEVYIHAPYIINLANTHEDDWAVNLLKKNLEVGKALGCRGVVVHVGKSKDLDIAAATETMRANIVRTLEAASAECPLLLETPAGQGTEMLCKPTEFLNFLQLVNSPLLRACVDTCHVFACGHDPVEYIDAVLATNPDLLRLVHFNDSMEMCGACKDRHAFVGTGKIGISTLETVANRCVTRSIPMVVE